MIQKTRDVTGNSLVSTVQFGLHFMVDGYGGCPEELANKASLTGFLTQLAERLGMHPIAEPQVVEVGPLNIKDPGGVSGFLLIAESHISFHTFPKRGFISIDIYTCQDTLDTQSILAEFKTKFALEGYDEQLATRGTQYPSKDIS